MISKLLEDLFRTIDQRIESIWTIEDNYDYLNAVSDGLVTICEKVNLIGEQAAKAIVTNPPDLEGTVIHYEWLREAKSFLILWRDIFFEFQKGLVLLSGEATDINSIKQQKIASKNALIEAALEFRTYFDKRLANATISNRIKASYIEKNHLKENPWTTYKEQIAVLSNQANQLKSDFKNLQIIVGHLNEYRSRINQTIQGLNHEADRIELIGTDVLQIISDNLESNPKRIVQHIDSLEGFVQASNHVFSYMEDSDNMLDNLIGKMKVPIAREKSEILYKEINFSRTFKIWMEGQIEPILLEIQELADRVGNNMKITLINVKNRIALKLSDTKEGTIHQMNLSRIKSPLLKNLESVKTDRVELAEFINQLKNRIEEGMSISAIYNTKKEFLGGAQQYLIEQLKLEQSPWISRFSNWIKTRIDNAKMLIANVAKEESLSNSEKIVRYVLNRNTQEANYQYTNIFASHGFMGDSFWVGRDAELNHVDRLVENWKSGFRGSVLLSGMRFCGKSVFGEVVSLRHFEKNTIRLTPDSTIEVNSRTYEVGFDIGKALEFVKKNSINDSHLIWIDDLELWQNSEHNIGANVQQLINYIDSLSSRHFFMVSCSNWFLYRYEQLLRINHVFQAEVNLDYMKEHEVRRAISIRHGATHKLLVDDEGQKVPPEDFEKMIHKVYHLAESNIGEALNLWSGFIEKGLDDNVICNPKTDFQIPDFLNDQNRILLRAILMNKKTNEYRLRKSFGSAFTEKYQAITQRLLNLGVLIRDLDGFLEINPCLVNDVARLLHNSKYINSMR